MVEKRLVGFSKALENPTKMYEVINKKTGRRLFETTFSKILEHLHSHVDDIEFIKFFDGVEIYELIDMDNK